MIGAREKPFAAAWVGVPPLGGSVGWGIVSIAAAWVGVPPLGGAVGWGVNRRMASVLASEAFKFTSEAPRLKAELQPGANELATQLVEPPVPSIQPLMLSIQPLA